MGKLFKIFSYKVTAIVLVIISAFTPIAKVHQYGVNNFVEELTFLSQDGVLQDWVALVALVTLGVLAKYFFKKFDIVFKIMVVSNIAWVLCIRSNVKEVMDNIYYGTGGYIPAYLSWGWYIIYLAIIVLIFGK